MGISLVLSVEQSMKASSSLLLLAVAVSGTPDQSHHALISHGHPGVSIAVHSPHHAVHAQLLHPMLPLLLLIMPLLQSIMNQPLSTINQLQHTMFQSQCIHQNLSTINQSQYISQSLSTTSQSLFTTNLSLFIILLQSHTMRKNIHQSHTAMNML